METTKQLSPLTETWRPNNSCVLCWAPSFRIHSYVSTMDVPIRTDLSYYPTILLESRCSKYIYHLRNGNGSHISSERRRANIHTSHNIRAVSLVTLLDLFVTLNRNFGTSQTVSIHTRALQQRSIHLRNLIQKPFLHLFGVPNDIT